MKVELMLGIGCMTAVEIYALHQGIDGALLSMYFSIIGGFFGFGIGKMKRKRKR